MYERLSRVFVQAQSFLHAKRKFPGYRPQGITWDGVGEWLKPYKTSDRRLLHKLIKHVRYFSEEETKRALVNANEKVLAQLSASGLGLDKVIYVQVHDAGSSSGVMLNLLRDTAKIEKSGCRFIDGNSRNLAVITRDLGEGAIIYVDDFAGSGKQFTRVHRQISPYIVGRFVEFFIAPCVAEEAIDLIGEEGVEVVTDEIHLRTGRPLQPECSILKSEERGRLLELSNDMYSKPGLGFKKLATMVVFARQCPNSVPLLIRGSVQQVPFPGLLPRTTDLPSRYLASPNSAVAKTET
jgi:hypothetical protein